MTDIHRYADEGAGIWEEHSGGSGHSGPEWGAADVGRAAEFAAALPASARRVLDHLVERPGRIVHCTELFERALARTDEANPASAVAGVIAGMRDAHDASGRRYPSGGRRRRAGPAPTTR